MDFTGDAKLAANCSYSLPESLSVSLIFLYFYIFYIFERYLFSSKEDDLQNLGVRLTSMHPVGRGRVVELWQET